MSVTGILGAFSITCSLSREERLVDVGARPSRCGCQGGGPVGQGQAGGWSRWYIVTEVVGGIILLICQNAQKQQSPDVIKLTSLPSFTDLISF